MHIQPPDFFNPSSSMALGRPESFLFDSCWLRQLWFPLVVSSCFCSQRLVACIVLMLVGLPRCALQVSLPLGVFLIKGSKGLPASFPFGESPRLTQPVVPLGSEEGRSWGSSRS